MRRLLTLCLFLLVAPAASAYLKVFPIWQYNCPSAVIFEPTIGGDGSVYFATIDGKLRSLNPSGVPAWEVDPGGVLVSPIALQNGYLLFGTSDQNLRCYGTNGHLAWKIKLDNNISTSLAVTASGIVVFGTTAGDVYGVDSKSVQIRWKYHAGYVVGPPSIGHDGTVYLVAENFMLALNPQSGVVFWRKDIFNFASVPITLDKYDNIVYMRVVGGAIPGFLDVLDYHGNIIWEAKDANHASINPRNVSPVVYGDLIITANQAGGDIYAFDSQTGAIVWQYSVANASNPLKVTPLALHSFAVDSTGELYWSDGNGIFAFLNADTGWLDGWWPTLPMKGGDVSIIGTDLTCRAYIPTGTNAIICSSTLGGPGAGPWCQAGGNSRHANRRDDPPAIDLVEPVDGQTVTGTLRVNANASDDFGMGSLSIYINGTLMDKASAGTIGWLTDSSTFQDGDYDVTVLAKDTSGNQSVETATVHVVNPPPTYTMGSAPPVFSWLSNGVDNKYLVTISTDPGFSSVVLSSSKKGHKWLKATSWQPSSKQWGQVISRAASSPGNPVTFYWRAVGQSGGTVVTKTFYITK